MILLLFFFKLLLTLCVPVLASIIGTHNNSDSDFVYKKPVFSGVATKLMHFKSS